MEDEGVSVSSVAAGVGAAATASAPPTPTTAPSLADLPPPWLQQIADFADLSDLFAWRHTCTTLHRVSSHTLATRAMFVSALHNHADLTTAIRSAVQLARPRMTARPNLVFFFLSLSYPASSFHDALAALESLIPADAVLLGCHGVGLVGRDAHGVLREIERGAPGVALAFAHVPQCDFHTAFLPIRTLRAHVVHTHSSDVFRSYTTIRPSAASFLTEALHLRTSPSPPHAPPTVIVLSSPISLVADVLQVLRHTVPEALVTGALASGPRPQATCLFVKRQDGSIERFVNGIVTLTLIPHNGEVDEEERERARGEQEREQEQPSIHVGDVDVDNSGARASASSTDLIADDSKMETANGGANNIITTASSSTSPSIVVSDAAAISTSVAIASTAPSLAPPRTSFSGLVSRGCRAISAVYRVVSSKHDKIQLVRRVRTSLEPVLSDHERAEAAMLRAQSGSSSSSSSSSSSHALSSSLASLPPLAHDESSSPVMDMVEVLAQVMHNDDNDGEASSFINGLFIGVSDEIDNIDGRVLCDMLEVQADGIRIDADSVVSMVNSNALRSRNALSGAGSSVGGTSGAGASSPTSAPPSSLSSPPPSSLSESPFSLNGMFVQFFELHPGACIVDLASRLRAQVMQPDGASAAAVAATTTRAPTLPLTTAELHELIYPASDRVAPLSTSVQTVQAQSSCSVSPATVSPTTTTSTTRRKRAHSEALADDVSLSLSSGSASSSSSSSSSTSTSCSSTTEAPRASRATTTAPSSSLAFASMRPTERVSTYGSLLFTCAGRGAGLFNRPNVDASVIERYTDGADVCGFFCNGEIGPPARCLQLQEAVDPDVVYDAMFGRPGVASAAAAATAPETADESAAAAAAGAATTATAASAAASIHDAAGFAGTPLRRSSLVRAFTRPPPQPAPGVLQSFSASVLLFRHALDADSSAACVRAAMRA